jgi:hypothetical protein
MVNKAIVAQMLPKFEDSLVQRMRDWRVHRWPQRFGDFE